jgi:hypothetical protein
MGQTHIIEEYNARSRSVENHREVALLLLIVSVIVLLVYAVNRTRIGLWGGVMLAAGLIFLALSLALALLSLLRLRCPNCSRVLIGVNRAAFCPGCGAALKGAGRSGTVSAAPQGSRRGASAQRGIVRRGSESRGIVSATDEYPEEAYPKDIRLFTTPDERVLTRRYIRLIDRDDRRRADDDLFPHSAAGMKRRGRRKPVAEPTAGRKDARPDGRRAEPQAEESGFLARVVGRIRRR